jgi:hypothetical protein
MHKKTIGLSGCTFHLTLFGLTLTTETTPLLSVCRYFTIAQRLRRTGQRIYRPGVETCF